MKKNARGAHPFARPDPSKWEATVSGVSGQKYPICRRLIMMRRRKSFCCPSFMGKQYNIRG
jgi:hypothetical protein